MSTHSIGRVLAICTGTLGVACAVYADSPAAAVLTGNDGPIKTPGVGKMLFAFAFTLAVGVGLIVVLRRLLPWFPKVTGQASLSNAPRVLGSRNVHPGLKLHLIDADGTAVLIVEGRGGIATTVLPSRVPATRPDSDAPTAQQLTRGTQV